MARFYGTGKDELGRYPEHIVVDLQEGTPEYDDLQARGWVILIPEDSADYPGRDAFQVASSVVRNDPLTDPNDRKAAAKIADRAHDIVHSGDPGAKKGSTHLPLKPTADNAPPGGRKAHDEVSHWDRGGVFGEDVAPAPAPKSAKS